MTFLYISELIITFISSFMILYFFNKIMLPKYDKYNKLFNIIMVTFYTFIPAININNIFIYLKGSKIVSFIIFYYLILLIYPIFFRKGRISEKFFLSSLFITTMIVSSFIVYSIAFKIFNVSFSEMFLIINYKRSILVFIVKIIQFVLLSFFIKNLNFIKLIKDVTLYSLAIILLLDHILVFIIERDVIANRDIINIDIITILFSLCSIQVLLIYILTIFLKEMEEKFLLKMNLNRKIHDKEIRDMYTEMIGWRHDFKNHISVILGLLQVSGKEAVIEYINEIDNSMSKLDKNIYTDNIAVNSILLSKIKIAEEKNIDIRLNLKINSKIKISNVDISTVLGNLIDNSIEACTNVKGYRFINLKIASENNILVFKISNSTNGYINEVNGRFLSTKNTEVSGIGLSQVDNIIKKYNGYINRSHKNNIFTTYIMIQ